MHEFIRIINQDQEISCACANQIHRAFVPNRHVHPKTNTFKLENLLGLNDSKILLLGKHSQKEDCGVGFSQENKNGKRKCNT